MRLGGRYISLYFLMSLHMNVFVFKKHDLCLAIRKLVERSFLVTLFYTRFPNNKGSLRADKSIYSDSNPRPDIFCVCGCVCVGGGRGGVGVADYGSLSRDCRSGHSFSKHRTTLAVVPTYVAYNR